MESDLRGKIVVEEEERPAGFLAAFEWGKAIGGQAEGNITEIGEKFIRNLLAVDCNESILKDPVVGAVEYILHGSLRLVPPTI